MSIDEFEQIQLIRSWSLKTLELSENATSGPWMASAQGDGDDDRPDQHYVYESMEDDPPIITCRHWQQEPNARLIALSRTFAPNASRVMLEMLGLISRWTMTGETEHANELTQVMAAAWEGEVGDD